VTLAFEPVFEMDNWIIADGIADATDSAGRLALECIRAGFSVGNILAAAIFRPTFHWLSL